MAGEKMKFSQRMDVFRDLIRFLTTEKLSIDGMQRSQLESLYNNQYLLYRRQIDPNSCDNLPDFKVLLSTAREAKQIFSNQSKLYLKKPAAKVASSGATGNARASAERGRSSSSRGSSHEPSPSPGQGASPGNQTARNNAAPRPTRRKRGQRRIAVDQHLTSLQKLAPLQDEAGETEDVTKFQYIGQAGGKFICRLCPTTMTSKLDTINHVKGKKHRVNYCLKMLKDKQEDHLMGKFGVTITSSSEEHEKGTYMIDSVEGKETLTDLTITNNGNDPVELTHCEMRKRLRVFKLMDQKRVTDGTGSYANILPGQSYKIQVRLLAKHVGSYHCPVMFQFTVNLPNKKTPFYMVRYLHGRCKDPIVEELKPKTKYKRPPQVAKMTDESVEIEAGEKPLSELEDKLERKIPLKMYRVPQKIRKMINRGLKEDSASLTESDQKEMSKLRSVLELPVCMQDYQTRFDALLYFEEVQMEVDIRKYDMEAVTMKVYKDNKRLLLLNVPGLAEKRPSVLVGDWLYVRICEPGGKLSKREYQGFVHAVLQSEVALGFSQNFRSQFVENQKFRVRFMFNRLPMCLQHRACEMARELTLDKILFPDNQLPQQYELPSLTFYNRDLERNVQQKSAVQHIVAGTSRPAPYIVFGPPGTGKTVTIVEAIKQVWKLNKGGHILACTPSNSACDLITARLLQHIPKSNLLRLNAKSRQWSAVPEAIKGVCNCRGGTTYFPDKTELQEYRIIVCTLVTAGRLVSANFMPGPFSHVFLDEAGHAVEPEALVPIAGVMEVSRVLGQGGQIVLAGDPKQLGPVLRSPLAIKYGLSTSLLERYMETCSLYIPGTTEDGHKLYDVRVISKLLQNYRSHPAILKLPNEMFYDSELQACASIDREKLCHWEGLPTKGFPVLFHGVIGEDMREERSPSFFNAEEVSLVVKYVEELMTCRKGGIKLREEDIGVISPYRKQVQKISQTLRKRKYGKITVGSVEEFQGAERTVIIVSTVRSKPEYLSVDMQFKLGFLRNPKRFNVTITRAKALLILIGNPETLCHDPYWKSLIEYCEAAGSYKGVSVGKERMSEEDQVEDLCQRLTSMSIINSNLECTLGGESEELSEQPWHLEV